MGTENLAQSTPPVQVIRPPRFIGESYRRAAG
jgi:hypothetical protein